MLAGYAVRIRYRLPLVCCALALALVLVGCDSAEDSSRTADGQQVREDCQAVWQPTCAEARAYWLSKDTLAWNTAADGDRFRLHFAPETGLNPRGDEVGGEAIVLSVDPNGLPADVTRRFPHLAGQRALKIAASDVPRIPALLKAQLALSVSDQAGKVLDATGLQIPGVLDDLFAYDGPLGVAFEGGVPVFRLWAPTARSVRLHLFATASASEPDTVLALAEQPGNGVWQARGDSAWAGMYFLYAVEVYVPETGRIETNLVTDPYSVSLAADSARSQIVNLADTALKPAGWDTFTKPPVDRFLSAPAAVPARRIPAWQSGSGYEKDSRSACSSAWGFRLSAFGDQVDPASDRVGEPRKPGRANKDVPVANRPCPTCRVPPGCPDT